MPVAQSVVSAKIVRERYYWPNAQLNMWSILVLVTGALELGVFAEFVSIQNRLQLPNPWLFPFAVTVGTLTVIMIGVMNALIMQRRLLPGLMIMLSFVLLVLYLTALIETGIVLFGTGNVQRNCQRYVNNDPQNGVSVYTLAWLQQSNICNCWYAAFAFLIVGVLCFIWMLVMASQVAQGIYDSTRGQERALL